MLQYYMFNKPRGYITARRDMRKATVMDFFPPKDREELFPVGRLDRDTEGFLLVTNDGELCFSLMSPDMNVPKTYFFWALGTLDSEKIGEIEGGVKIYETRPKTAPAKIEITDVSTLGEIKELLSDADKKITNKRANLPVVSGLLTITEGKKHQVKRMLGYVGCRVVYLKRINIGGVMLDNSLAPGEYRPMTDEELEKIKNPCIQLKEPPKCDSRGERI